MFAPKWDSNVGDRTLDSRCQPARRKQERANRKLTFRTHQVATFPLLATDEPNRPDGERP